MKICNLKDRYSAASDYRQLQLSSRYFFKEEETIWEDHG